MLKLVQKMETESHSDKDCEDLARADVYFFRFTTLYLMFNDDPLKADDLLHLIEQMWTCAPLSVALFNASIAQRGGGIFKKATFLQFCQHTVLQ